MAGRTLPACGAIVAIATSCLVGPAWAQWENSLKPKGTPAGEITLARAGKTDYVIVIPSQPTTQEQKAAEDLALWLGKMTTAQFPIVSDRQPPRPMEISVGQTNRLRGAKFPQARADLGDEGYAIGVDGDRLLLVGGRKRGPIYAVYALLEEDLGCRWYHADSSRIPLRRNLRFRPVPRSFVPPLMIRDPFYFDAFNGTWSLRNRTNAPNASVPEEWGGHVDYDGLFVHTYNRLVPPSKYFKEHPEYYSLIGGKRTPRQLCETNPDVIRIATESVLEFLRENPNTEVVSVSPNDGGGHCTCPRCQAINDENGSPAGSLLYLVNHVAEAVQKKYPGVMVSTLAYLDTVDPPKKIRPAKNVAIRLCNDLHSWRYPMTCFVTDTKPASKRYRDALVGWSKICNNIHIWDYFVNFSHYMAPMPNMHVLEPSVRFYVDHHVTGIMMQGAYQSPGGARVPMRCWVMAKLLWDPSRDVSELMRDFVFGYYENAAPAVWEYYQALEQTRLEHLDTINTPDGGIRYPMDSPFLSKEFLNKATAIFERAEKMAKRSKVRRRVQVAKLPIMYVKLMRGPAFVGENYGQLLDEFEAICRREGVTHFREGAPDFQEKIQGWRDALRISKQLPQIGKEEVGVWPLPATWKFATDPDDIGVKQKWFALSFDDSGWAAIRTDLGKGWESQGFADYTGVGWYRQAVDVPADLSRRHLYLYFGAVDEDAWVYLNDQLAFEHTCKSTGLRPEQIWTRPFSFDAHPFIQPGRRNTVAVRVYNRMGMGGIYLPVQIVAADKDLDTPLLKAIIESGKYLV